MTRLVRPHVLSLILSLVAWELLARAIGSPILPPLSTVLRALAELASDGTLLTHLSASLVSLVVGFAAALAVGVPVGVWMGTSRRAGRLFDPYLTAGLATPALIWVPVVAAVGGLSRLTHVAAVFVFSVFTITSYAVAGVRAASPTLVEMARAFGATRRQIFWQIIWPGARPELQTGLRVGAGLAVKGMVNGEMLIATAGLGALIRIYGGRFEPEKVLALLLIVTVMALATTGLVRRLGESGHSARQQTMPPRAAAPPRAAGRGRGVISVLAAEGLALPVGVILSAVMARVLGVDGYGVLAIAASAVATAEWVLTSLFSRATIKLIGETGDHPDVATAVIHWHLVAGLLASGVLWAAALPLSAALGEPRLASCLALLACEIPFVAVATGYRNVMTGHLRFTARAAAGVARWLALLVSVSALTVATRSLSGAAIGNVAGAALGLLIVRHLALRPAVATSAPAATPSGAARVTPRSASFWSVAIPAFLLALSLRLLDKVGLVALKWLGASTREVGWYAAAQNFSVAPGLLALAFSPLLLAQMSRALGSGDLSAARAEGRHALRLVAAVTPFAALAAGSSHEIIQLVYGAAFAPAATLATPFLISALGVMTISVTSAMLTAAGHARAASRSTWPILPLALVGYLVAVPRFGSLGAAWVTAGSTAVGAALSLVAVASAWQIGPPSGTIARGVALAAPAFLIAAAWSTPGAWWILKATLVSLAILLGFVGLGELSPEDRHALRASVGARRVSPGDTP